MFCKIHDIFVYVIKRTVHGRLEIEQDMEFIFLCSNRLKTVNSWDIDLDLTVEDKFHISARPCIILYLLSSALRLIYHIDYEQSLFFLGPSSKTPKTRKWPRAWLKVRDGRGCRPRFSRLASRVSRLASRVSRLASRVSRFASRFSRLASRVSQLRRSTLARTCTPLTKSEEKERQIPPKTTEHR